MNEPICALIVEDEAVEAELIVERLLEDGFAPAWRRVDGEASFVAALATRPDIVISDWRLPRFSGRRALEIVRERDEDIPFVIVSGYIGEDAAVEALHAGADDYVQKDRLARLGPAVRMALEHRRLRDEARLAEAQLRLAATVFESNTEGITITDPRGSILAVNRAFTEITGYAATDVVGRNPSLLQSGRHDRRFYADMWASLAATGRWRGEIWNRRKDGRVFPAWTTISAVHDVGGGGSYYVGVFGDMADVKQAKLEAEYLAHHDALTGLPNRLLLLDRLTQDVRRASAAGTRVAVLCLDLDGFGAVNDALGYVVGDALLQAVASRLTDVVGARGSLSRSGGDEFLVILEDVDGSAQAASAGRELQDRLAKPLAVADHEVLVTATIGVAMFPEDGTDADLLAREAETAMRRAKQRGPASIGLFEVGLPQAIADRLDLARDLRDAAVRNQLTVQYQPQVHFGDGSLAGAEALVRWNHPSRGVISPADFIPLAEDTGSIDEIGAWVLREACRQVAAWDATGLHLPRVSVNLSAHQLDHVDLASLVADALAAAGLEAIRLELEVTETMVMGDVVQSSAVLRDLCALGVAVALDDFGTGHSSLAKLSDLPLHRLKIDRSFVNELGVERSAEAIVRATVVLARSLGLESVAEGVETEAQAEFLRTTGCEIAQGYLYGRPLSPDAFLARFGERKGA